MKERVTISVETEALDVAREAVRAGRAPNLSAAVEAALKARGRAVALREAVELAEQEHGPVGEEMEQWAIQELRQAASETSSSTPER
jgi:glucosamine 6-phosphate synthetase-like amidotransferase/phosphosugar isomerase protein